MILYSLKDNDKMNFDLSTIQVKKYIISVSERHDVPFSCSIIVKNIGSCLRPPEFNSQAHYLLSS